MRQPHMRTPITHEIKEASMEILVLGAVGTALFWGWVTTLNWLLTLLFNWKCRQCNSRETWDWSRYDDKNSKGKWATWVHCRKCDAGYQATEWKQFWFPKRIARWVNQLLRWPLQCPTWSPF